MKRDRDEIIRNIQEDTELLRKVLKRFSKNVENSKLKDTELVIYNAFISNIQLGLDAEDTIWIVKQIAGDLFFLNANLGFNYVFKLKDDKEWYDIFTYIGHFGMHLSIMELSEFLENLTYHTDMKNPDMKIVTEKEIYETLTALLLEFYNKMFKEKIEKFPLPAGRTYKYFLSTLNFENDTKLCNSMYNYITLNKK
jgi:hypothetical protein